MSDPSAEPLDPDHTAGPTSYHVIELGPSRPPLAGPLAILAFVREIVTIVTLVLVCALITFGMIGFSAFADSVGKPDPEPTCIGEVC